jgi:hypothetical protein
VKIGLRCKTLKIPVRGRGSNMKRMQKDPDLREDFTSTSDVDVLIEFEPGYSVGLLKMARMENEFSGLLGRPADLRAPRDLGHYFRQEVIRDAEVQYAEG